jgi:hypothetical protein
MTRSRGSRRELVMQEPSQGSAYLTRHRKVNTENFKNLRKCFTLGSSAYILKWVLNREALTNRWCASPLMSLFWKMFPWARWWKTTDNWPITSWAHLENYNRNLQFQKLTTTLTAHKEPKNNRNHKCSRMARMLPDKPTQQHFWSNWVKSKFYSYFKTPKSCLFLLISALNLDPG